MRPLSHSAAAALLFYGQVNGKITGAVFKGQGHLRIIPPNEEEGRNLFLQMHTEVVNEDFDRAVFRFTDSTADELRRASTGQGPADGDFTRDAQELQTFLRHHSVRSVLGSDGTYYFKTFYGNLDLRLLEDVLSPASGQYFMAAMHANKYGHLFFILDPHGIDEVAPEEVALLNWDSTNDVETIPLAFHRAAEYLSDTANGNEHNSPTRILDENLDVTIEKSGLLSNVATVDVRAEQDGVAVVPLAPLPRPSVLAKSLPVMESHSIGFRRRRTKIPTSAWCSLLLSKRARPRRSKSHTAAVTSS
ncbi:MAG: hypothetical protein WDM87_10265 [Terracidiphilus sp.]